MGMLLVALCVVGYFLIGTIYLLAYILVFKPEPRDAQLGLTVLFWWIYLLIEIVLAFSVQAGRFAKATAAKLQSQ